MNKIDTNMYGSYPYYINLIIRPPTPKNEKNTLKTNINFPPKIDVNKIYLMSDVSYLSQLEVMYDNFLNKNQHLLSLYNIIDDMLDIRDALTIQVSKLKRKEITNKLYLQHKSNTNINTNNINSTKYNNTYNNELLYSYYQKYLPIQLQLNNEQIKQEYKIMTNEPKEYKCGCQTIRYTRVNNKSKNNSNQTILKKSLYCVYHNNLKRKEKILLTELKIIRKEIMNIKRDTNSIDFEIETCKMLKDSSNNNNNKSKYPWKQK
jgi:hypothetical protein